MYHVSQKIHFCYGHRLLDYEGKCAHLHGHDAQVQIELGSDELDKAGMVVDFSEIRRRIGRFLDEKLDHQMLLRQDDPLIPILLEQGEPIYVMQENPTAENIARLIFEQAKAEGLPVLSVRLWESPTAYAEYSAERGGKIR
ncbi:MAG TPA: 6-carboxytetrahydropterin synthase [bacterium]|nr:6-carboxytetrahydropterin synthase [bacterium]